MDHVRETRPTPLETELGIVIQAELKRMRLTAKAFQALSGINDKTFRRYFVASERHIPVVEAQRAAAALGLPLSVLVARAEHNLAARSDVVRDLSEIKGLTAAERKALLDGIEHNRPQEGNPGHGSQTG